MALFRTPHAEYEKTFNAFVDSDTLHANEWDNTDRIKEPAWESRYDHEANMVVEVMGANNLSGSILEILI